MRGRINVTLGNDARVILVTFLHYVLFTLAKHQSAMLFRLEDAAYNRSWVGTSSSDARVAVPTSKRTQD